MSRVLLISTYELGAQPLGLASIAGSLRSAGHEVRASDLAIESFDGVDLDWPDAVGFSVPMHTALRLALAARSRLGQQRKEVPACFFGLYAEATRISGVAIAGDLFVAGEALGAITAWLDGDDGSFDATVVELGTVRRGGSVSGRDLLSPLERYRDSSPAMPSTWSGPSNRREAATTAAGTARCRSSTAVVPASSVRTP